MFDLHRGKKHTHTHTQTSNPLIRLKYPYILFTYSICQYYYDYCYCYWMVYDLIFGLVLKLNGSNTSYAFSAIGV